MRIQIKSPEEIKIMQEGGRRLNLIMKQLLLRVKPGVRLLDLDKLADKMIVEQKGEASFKKVRNYKWASCININEGVVHGIPDNYQIKTGDLVSIDIGIFYQGFNTDMAWTVLVGKNKSKFKFLDVGEKTLTAAIGQVKPGNRIGNISQTIEQNLRKAGLHPVKELTGHGVGRQLHEEPMIPGITPKNIEKTPLLTPGLTLAIEIIYTKGSPSLVMGGDGWTIETADRSWSGLFEKTVAVTTSGLLILT